MADDSNTDWSAEDIYDERISPLMTQIIAICKEHQIPMAATFQFEHTEDNGPGFCTTILPFPRAHEKLLRVANVMRPEHSIMLAETHVTQPDGSKRISIRRVS